MKLQVYGENYLITVLIICALHQRWVNTYHGQWKEESDMKWQTEPLETTLNSRHRYSVIKLPIP